MVVLALAVAGLVLVRPWAHGSGQASVGPGGTGTPSGSTQPSPSATDSAVPSGSVPASAPAANVPDKGAGTFAFAGGPGPVLGTAGTLRRYRVAVENGSGQVLTAFTATVDKILADPKGWTAAGTVRFQRVPEKSGNEVTIYLATPATTDQLCAAGGLHVQKFLSCRLPGQIVINLARWLTAVPGYGAPLTDYQEFALNHEIGRDLGYANQACPGEHLDAPVMQQQSLSLDGCVANPWPYPHGSLYQGRPIP